MNILVTGAAGFIGSHLCERLLRSGHQVIGVDGFIGTTPDELKIRNLRRAEGYRRFRLVKVDLLRADWEKLLDGINAVFHLAGTPGVRSSWGDDFKDYVDHNILATQRLLEACRGKPLQTFAYASTSSVYGETNGKTNETRSPTPLSPYGVSKLSGEYLCRVYHDVYDVPVVILRYFTVYGPRQRPDMAFHRFIRSILLDEPVSIYGDGKQTRDFTYVTDCVAGTQAVLKADGVIAETVNIGGTERASVLEVVGMLEEIIGKKAILEFQGNPYGEPKHTWADVTKAKRILGYEPRVRLRQGLAEEVNDLTCLYGRKKS
jgi:nucleoside-diphosphate-sugar epimerase